ncbi:hypothetical protein K2X14_11620 [Acetobacter sp. TBRC 12305]|uniref:Uncharacterized protein n=1 Tax=Acetobacter garciniae TaxID=2817435 RepID=A0A939HN77_9PROT|nr:hypothetical protein [Acetobacter garciniae]MBO1325341.1 hypothetical protein [Acetobacter garciniae]MBX0345487.1 hypothetical protein [Acetobacter garciniae]
MPSQGNMRQGGLCLKNFYSHIRKIRRLSARNDGDIFPNWMGKTHYGGEAMNTFIYNTQTGKTSAKINVQVTADYECECGNKLEISLEWPEDLIVRGQITVNNARCPMCHSPVVLPRAEYYSEGHRLFSRAIE